ncbi:MAG: nitroreductase family protein [Pseudomonadales bacterium]
MSLIEIHLASVDEVLKTARSVRRKLDLDRHVSDQTILDCIQIATQAPVALGGENWRFLLIRSEEKKKQIAATYREVMTQLTEERGISIKKTHRSLMDNMASMPCLILVFAIGEPGEKISTQTAFYGSVLPAAWSLMLALRARGLGTTWTTLLSSRQEEIREILNVPDGVTHTVMFPVAYTKDAVMKPADRVAPEQVTYLDRWDNQIGQVPSAS